MYGKKSQASIYIILGVILLLIVFFTVALLTSSNRVDSTDASRIIAMSDVDQIVELCLIQTLDKGLLDVGFNGGFARVYEQSVYIPTLVGDVHYWVKDGRRLFINSDFVGRELEMYIDDRIGDCVENLSLEYQVDFISSESEIIVNDRDVIARTFVSAIFKRGEIEKRPDVVSVRKDVNLGLMLQQAKEFIEDISDGEETLTMERDFILMEFYQNSSTSIYSLFDNDIIIDGINHQLMFAVDKTPARNYPPRLIKKDVLYGRVGEKMIIEYEAEDDHGPFQLMFSSSSMEIPQIDMITGIIEFTPEEPGEFTSLITVMDGFRQTDMDVLIVQVEQ